MNQRPAGLTPHQAARVGAAAQRIEQHRKGAPPSSHRPTNATIVLGKLTQAVKRNDGGTFADNKGKFTLWCAPSPDDDTSQEAAAVSWPETDCWAHWSLVDQTQIPSGARVTLVYAAGRWWVINSDTCPGPIPPS
ncbi:MAG: hypothetical protein JSS27_00975 [Planctomycetes bacterium]|nr:hypothetical protein [Planctomycetota bacterium]